MEALQDLPPHYRQELVEELMISDEELERWRDSSQKMTVVFHVDGVLSHRRPLYASISTARWPRL